MVDYPNNPPAGSSQFTSATPYRGVTTARPSSPATLMSMPSSSPAGGGYAETLRADTAMRSLPAPTAAAGPTPTRNVGSMPFTGDSEAGITDARNYLRTTASPGGTMSAIGLDKAIDNLNPDYAVAAANAVSAARAAGLKNAGLFSAFRPPDVATRLGVKGMSDKYQSFHAYGLAGDFAGVGTLGSAENRKWFSIANAAGLTNPYMSYGAKGYSGNPKEYNHMQLTSAHRAARDVPGLRETISGTGPVDREAMWRIGSAAPRGAGGTAVAVRTPPTPTTREAALGNIANRNALGYAPAEAEPGAAGAAAAMGERTAIPAAGAGPKTDFDTSRGMMDLDALRSGQIPWNSLPQDARDFVVQKYGPMGQAAYERWQSSQGAASGNTLRPGEAQLAPGGAAPAPAATAAPPRPATPPTAAPGPVADVPTPRENPRLQLGTGNDPATYTVMPGDTLFDIAVERYGDPNMARQLAGMNGIRNPRTLQPGQTLRLPPTAAEVPTPRARPDPNKIGPTYSEGGDATLTAGGRRLPYDTTGVPAVPRGTLPPTRTGGPDISFSPGGGFSAQPQGNRSMYVGDEGGAPGSRGATGTRDYAAELRRGLDTTGVAGEPAFSATSPSRLANTMLNRTPIMANDPNYPVSVDTGGFRSGSSAGRVDTSRAATPRAPMGAQTPYPNPFAVRSREDELRSMLAQRALDAAMQRRQLGGL
jgi:LysM repeat protein